MMGYILVLIIFGVGSYITPMPGTYPNKEACYNAGVEAVNGLGNRYLDLKFTCVPTEIKTP